MTVIPSFLIRESAEVYQAQRAEYLTSHQLADFRRSPLLYRKKKLGLIEEEDRPAFLVGRALHTLVLEGRDAFEEQYAVGGPVNPKTGELYGSNTKAFAEWAAEQGKPVLTVQQYDLVERMAEGIRSHGLAKDLLSEGIPEGVVRAEYCQTPCQIRMDWFDPQRGIVDLRACASPAPRSAAEGRQVQSLVGWHLLINELLSDGQLPQIFDQKRLKVSNLLSKSIIAEHFWTSVNIIHAV